MYLLYIHCSLIVIFRLIKYTIQDQNYFFQLVPGYSFNLKSKSSSSFISLYQNYTKKGDTIFYPSHITLLPKQPNAFGFLGFKKPIDTDTFEMQINLRIMPVQDNLYKIALLFYKETNDNQYSTFGLIIKSNQNTYSSIDLIIGNYSPFDMIKPQSQSKDKDNEESLERCTEYFENRSLRLTLRISKGSNFALYYNTDTSLINSCFNYHTSDASLFTSPFSFAIVSQNSIDSNRLAEVSIDKISLFNKDKSLSYLYTSINKNKHNNKSNIETKAKTVQDLVNASYLKNNCTIESVKQLMTETYSTLSHYHNSLNTNLRNNALNLHQSLNKQLSLFYSIIATQVEDTYNSIMQTYFNYDNLNLTINETQLVNQVNDFLNEELQSLYSNNKTLSNLISLLKSNVNQIQEKSDITYVNFNTVFNHFTETINSTTKNITNQIDTDYNIYCYLIVLLILWFIAIVFLFKKQRQISFSNTQYNIITTQE